MAPYVLHSFWDFAQIYTARFVPLKHTPESSVFAMSKDGVVQVVLLMLDVVFSVSPKFPLCCAGLFFDCVLRQVASGFSALAPITLRANAARSLRAARPSAITLYAKTVG